MAGLFSNEESVESRENECRVERGKGKKNVDELRTAGQISETTWDDSRNTAHGDKPDDIGATIDSIIPTGCCSDEAFTKQVTYLRWLT